MSTEARLHRYGPCVRPLMGCRNEVLMRCRVAHWLAMRAQLEMPCLSNGRLYKSLKSSLFRKTNKDEMHSSNYDAQREAVEGSKRPNIGPLGRLVTRRGVVVRRVQVWCLVCRAVKSSSQTIALADWWFVMRMEPWEKGMGLEGESPLLMHFSSATKWYSLLPR